VVVQNGRYLDVSTLSDVSALWHATYFHLIPVVTLELSVTQLKVSSHESVLKFHWLTFRKPTQPSILMQVFYIETFPSVTS
jgi:hypothetical protein